MKTSMFCEHIELRNDALSCLRCGVFIPLSVIDDMARELRLLNVDQNGEQRPNTPTARLLRDVEG